MFVFSSNMKLVAIKVGCFFSFVSRIDSVDVSGQRVFIRVDFNVPQDKKEIFGQRVVGSS